MSSIISPLFPRSAIKLITPTNLTSLQRNTYATHTVLYSLRKQLNSHPLSQWPPKPPPPPPTTKPTIPKTPKTTTQKQPSQSQSQFLKLKYSTTLQKHRRQNTTRRNRKINPLKIYTQTLGSSSDNKGGRREFRNQIQNILKGHLVYEDEIRFLKTWETYWKRQEGFVFGGLEGVGVGGEERAKFDGCWGLAGCFLGFVVGVKVYIDWKVGVGFYGLRRGRVGLVGGLNGRVDEDDDEEDEEE